LNESYDNIQVVLNAIKTGNTDYQWSLLED